MQVKSSEQVAEMQLEALRKLQAGVRKEAPLREMRNIRIRNMKDSKNRNDIIGCYATCQVTLTFGADVVTTDTNKI